MSLYTNSMNFYDFLWNFREILLFFIEFLASMISSSDAGAGAAAAAAAALLPLPVRPAAGGEKV